MSLSFVASCLSPLKAGFEVLPTLTEFFESHYKPIRIDAMGIDPKTERSYRESLKLWDRLSANKTIDQITQLDTAGFVRDLAKERGKKIGSTMKRSSVSKHAVQLTTVLNMAGPRSSHNKRGQNLIPEPPFFEAPRVDKTPPRSNWTIAEVRAMYSAADLMTNPVVPCGDTPAFWRALVTGAYYLGLRIYALLHIKFSMIQDGWITVPGSISKGGKGSRHFVHPEAMEHFERIRVDGCDELLMYPKWERGRRLLYDYLRKLQALAGIAVDRWFGFHSFRKTHTTELASLTLEGNQAIDIASRSANHSDRSITTDFYISADVQEQLMQQAILRMRSPCVRSVPVVEPVQLPERRLQPVVRRSMAESELIF